MRQCLFLSLVWLAAGLVLPAHGQSVTLDFSGVLDRPDFMLFEDSETFGTIDQTVPIQENGFEISFLPGIAPPLVEVMASGGMFSDLPAITIGGAPFLPFSSNAFVSDVFRLSRLDGGLFDLDQVVFFPLSGENSFFVDRFTLTGIRPDGSTVTEDLVVDAFSLLVADLSQLTDVQEVVFQNGSSFNSAYGLVILEVSAPLVPTPGAVATWIVLLGGLATRHRPTPEARG